MYLQLNKYLPVLFLIFSLNAAAQRTREVQHQNHFWTSINTQARISNKFFLVGDFHVRRTNYLKNNNFYYTRAGVGYIIKKNLS